MSLIQRITLTTKLPGLPSGRYGYAITRPWITAITFAGFVVIGLHQMKSRWITLNQERQITHLTLIIFNLHIATATITKGVKDGSQK